MPEPKYDIRMQIQIASPDDLEFIEGAYEHARAFMALHN